MRESSLDSNYYAVLGLSPSASVQQIRRAYREKSKLFHPDTTELPAAIATAKFQQLNEAYATLSSPEKRVAYDLKLGYSRVSVMQAPADLNRPVSESRYRRSAYLDPSDRPLSAGELFALFILGLTFVACLVLVVAVGLTRSEVALHTMIPAASQQVILEQVPMPAEAMVKSEGAIEEQSLPAFVPSDPVLEKTDDSAPAATPNSSQVSPQTPLQQTPLQSVIAAPQPDSSEST